MFLNGVTNVLLSMWFSKLQKERLNTGKQRYLCKDCGYIIDIPSWVEVDWQKTWDDALSFDYSTVEDDGVIYFFNNVQTTVFEFFCLWLPYFSKVFGQHLTEMAKKDRHIMPGAAGDPQA